MAINATRVSAGDALDVLRAAWGAQSGGGLTASWMLHGRPGVGKSDIIAQLAVEIGAELFDLRLTTAGEAELIQFADAIDDAGNIFTELVLNLLHDDRRVFDDIMQERGADTFGIQF